MATKLTGWFGKFFAVLFTSIIAPVVVNLAVRDTPNEESRVVREERPALRQMESSQPLYSFLADRVLSQSAHLLFPQGQNASPTTVHPPRTVRIIAFGVGRSPETALQNALHSALRQALASQVDEETWARNGSALFAGIVRDNGSLIRGWTELGTRKEWKLSGLFYRKTATVEVNLTALAERLRPVPPLGWSDPIQARYAQQYFPPTQIQE